MKTREELIAKSIKKYQDITIYDNNALSKYISSIVDLSEKQIKHRIEGLDRYYVDFAGCMMIDDDKKGEWVNIAELSHLFKEEGGNDGEAE